MVYVDLVEKHAYIDNDLIIEQLKQKWRHLFTDKEIGLILAAMSDGQARVERELIEPQEGDIYYIYEVEISPCFCREHNLPQIKFDMKE